MSAGADGRIPPIARRVGEHRRRRGLTQVQLAARVGRSPMWVDQLEHGDLEWIGRLERGLVEAQEIPVLTDLACVLGISLAELVGPGVVMFPPPSPRPPRRIPRPRRPTARAAAAAAVVVVAAGAGAVGLGRVLAAPTAAHPQDHVVAAALLSPATPAATASATADPTATPTSDPTAQPAPAPTAAPSAAPPPPTPRPAPARPAARVVVATPAPHPPSGVSVFPWQVTASVSAGNGAGSPVLTFTVSNPGDVAETLGTIGLDNGAAHVVRDDCSRATLAPRDDCHISVRLGAATPGRYTGPLVIPVAGARTSTVPIEIDVR